MYNYNLDDSNILEPLEGFNKGNMFKNLYIPYKNYIPQNINPQNDKEALMYQLMEYNFALNDLDLYLILNSDDTQALSLYNKYINIRDNIKKKYESIYGPICNDYIFNNTYSYVKTSWPWEERYNV